MSKAGCEQRREARVLFSRQEQVTCHLSFPGNTKTILKAIVLNMSRRGIGLALDRNNDFAIQRGMLLDLNKIRIFMDKTERELEFHENIKVQVQWVMDDTVVNQIGIGCKYINWMPAIHQKICHFVNSAFSGRMELIQAE